MNSLPMSSLLPPALPPRKALPSTVLSSLWRKLWLLTLLVAGSLSGQENSPFSVGHDPFVGHWTYRSFLNRAEHDDDINNLLFGEAELIFERASLGEVKGALNLGDAGSLTLRGAVAYGNPFSIRFQGVGKASGSPSEGWVYDYVGWYVPSWPNGVDQKPAIVGSVIRTVPHSDGRAKAGVVASFIAVKRVPVLPRENIKTFSQDPTKLAKLRAAVAALKARGLDDATSWFSLAAIHGIRSDDPDAGSVPAPIRALWNQCHSDESLFFLWHRAYVAAMERLMQDAIDDPDFRLPYWNWYADPSLPEAFRNEYLDAQHTKKNPLYMPNRNDGINAGNPVWSAVVRTNFDNADFASFQDQLNFGEHGTIHIGVGKADNMANILFAARDPIFFLHHVNIDRLLPVWLKIDPNTHRVPTSFPAWNPAVYRFPVPGGGVATPTIQDLALGSIEAMGYNYDNTDRPEVPAPVLPARPENLRLAPAAPVAQNASKHQTFAAVKAIDKAIEVGAAGTVDLTIEPSHREKIAALLDASPRAAGLAIVLDNVQVKEVPPGVLSYSVFVNLPKEASNEGFRDHYVGSISLFALQHAAEGHGSTSVKLRLTSASGAPALKKGLTSDVEAASRVSISLIPELAPGASAPKTPVLSIDQIRLEEAP